MMSNSCNQTHPAMENPDIRDIYNACLALRMSATQFVAMVNFDTLPGSFRNTREFFKTADAMRLDEAYAQLTGDEPPFPAPEEFARAVRRLFDFAVEADRLGNCQYEIATPLFDRYSSYLIKLSEEAPNDASVTLHPTCVELYVFGCEEAAMLRQRCLLRQHPEKLDESEAFGFYHLEPGPHPCGYPGPPLSND